MTCRLALLACLAVPVVACGDGRPPNGPGPSAAAPTFTQDVAPILHKNCAPCHRPGQWAPFSLLTYADARSKARAIVAATGRRYMPPWLPDEGHGDFRGERRLPAADVEILRRWAEAGAPEGDPAALPAAPVFPDGWRLGTPDLVLKLPAAYGLKPSGGDIWRNFVIPIPVDRPRYVRTVELLPGSAHFVHHALMAVDVTRASRRRDAQDAEQGFAGMDMGDSQAPDGHLLGWTPGMTPFPGIEGKAWRLDPGTDLVLQLHLMPSGREEAVDPQIGLYFTEAPPVGPPMHLMRLDADQMLDIPPGAKDFVVTDSLTLPTDVDVYAVYPHAHFLGKTMEARATLPDGTERWIIRIADWDFKWQDVYTYRQPLPLPAGTTISMRFTYDNSADNPRNPSRPPHRVTAGFASSDEMAHLQLQVLPKRAEDALLLKEAIYRRAVVKTPGDPWVHYELGNVFRDKGQRSDAMREYRAALALDASQAAIHNNLGIMLMDGGEVDAAIAQYREALRVEPDFAEAHYNLANALRATGRLADAIGHYRDTLRLEPNFAEAHSNLGAALGSSGRIDEALAEFRQALRINPDDAEAHNNLGAGLAMQGRMDEAIGHFRDALRLAPGHAGATRNLDLALQRRPSAAGRRP